MIRKKIKKMEIKPIIILLLLFLTSCSNESKRGKYSIISNTDNSFPLEEGMPVYHNDSLVIGKIEKIKLKKLGNLELDIRIDEKYFNKTYSFCYEYGIIRNYIRAYESERNDTLKICSNFKNSMEVDDVIDSLGNWLKEIRKSNTE